MTVKSYLRERRSGFPLIELHVVLAIIAILAAMLMLPGEGRGEQRGVQRPTTVKYKTARTGRVSAAVYDGEGQLLRTLLRGQKKPAGEHSLRWDGLDRGGQPQPPGEYNVKVLWTPGFTAEFLFQLGVSPESGRHHYWIGNLSNSQRPGAVAVDGDAMFLGCGISEIVPTLMKQSLDGRKRHWAVGGFEPWKGPVGLAADGEGTLYVLLPNNKVYLVKDEEASRLGKGVKREDAWLHPTHHYKSKIVRDVWNIEHEKGASKSDFLSIAASGSEMIIAYTQYDVLRWLDSEGGVRSEIDVSAPAGVAITPGGVVLVGGEGGLLEIGTNGSREWLARGFPGGPVAYDSKAEDVLVADRSTRQIRRYDMDGEMVRTYGQKGGRSNGPYDPHSFRKIEDIACDGEGGFYVVEWSTPPRRTVHFDRQGRILNEWFGGQDFFMIAEPDPRDPSQVWFTTGVPKGDSLVLADIDYQNRSWYPKEVYELNRISKRMGGGVSAFQVLRSRHPRVFYHEDKRYLIAESFPQVLRHADGELIPVARGAVATHRFPHQKKWLQNVNKFASAPLKRPASFLWTDADQNGSMEPEEVQMSRWTNGWYNGWSGFSVLEDGSLLATGYVRGNPEKRRQSLFTFPVEEWRQGVPYYQLLESVRHRAGDGSGAPVGTEYEIASIPVEGRTGLAGAGAEGTLVDEKGNHYALWGVTHARRPDAHGLGSFSSRVARTRLTKWDREGNVRWSIGRHWHGERVDQSGRKRGENYPRGANIATPPPGVFHAPCGLLGMTHDALVVADRTWQPAQVWTSDGLYAGYFLDSRVQDDRPNWVYQWWRAIESGEESLINYDCLHKGAIAELDNGDVIWFAPGRNSTPVYRIRGWEGWAQQEHTIQLTQKPVHAARNGSGLTGVYFSSADADLTTQPDAERTDPRIWFVHKSRFKELNQWKNGPDLLDGKKTDFAVRWDGDVEACLSERTTFSVYAAGAIRLKVNGKTVINRWDEEDEYRVQSAPIELKAGERVPVQLDYRTTMKQPHISLNWDSFSMERERLPTAFLYPIGPRKE